MNAEIVSGEIQNFKDAFRWLSNSYFGIRIIKNPEIYGLKIQDINKKHEEIE